MVKHNLYECALENIIRLIELNKDVSLLFFFLKFLQLNNSIYLQKAIAILVDNIEKLPIKRVVDELSKKQLYLHYVIKVYILIFFIE